LTVDLPSAGSGPSGPLNPNFSKTRCDGRLGKRLFRVRSQQARCRRGSTLPAVQSLFFLAVRRRRKALLNDAGAADAEPKRVFYDCAAANTLVSTDIALCKTGLSDMEFVGISGDNVKGGDVGSATVLTTDEYELGCPLVIPVTEAHTMDTLQKGTMLLSGCDVYNKGGTVIICGESKRCEYWLPRREDGTQEMVRLKFKDRVLQLESDPAAVVPGIVTSDDWSAPTAMGVNQRPGGAEHVSLASFHTGNIYMALRRAGKWEVYDQSFSCGDAG
jgi:hypothetical protein